MPHERSPPDDGRGETDDVNRRKTRSSGRLLGRRRYLGLAGAATAAVGLVGSASTLATNDGYETIVVGAGDHRLLTVGAGETLENVLVDVTADGASATIDAHASGTRIRNVGFRGRMDDPPTGIIGVSETGGGTSVVENVYLGDGAGRGHRNGLGVWVSPAHSGHLLIDRVNVQEMGDNSFYCSASGDRGTVALRNCYSANSWVAHYRLARGSVDNCVALNDERRDDGRGIWAWSPGAVEVTDCDLATNGRHYAIVAGANGHASRVTVSDTRMDADFHGGVRRTSGSSVTFEDGVGGDPNGHRIPDGCPTSAEAAASGASTDRRPDSGDASSRSERTLELAGQFRYRIEVDGSIAPSDSAARWLTEGEAYGEDWVEWWLSGSEDARTEWTVTGELTDVTIDPYDGVANVATFRLGGESVVPESK
ncbi:hypothetical protein [Halovivax limisalsi]|uniref:hypothetical protein n=1 Tax=Halovivax limisalsi TaxID=1453760 RepID=UPI001FFC2ED5|nr:hypothetical protein [Halovivax limisalsi]